MEITAKNLMMNSCNDPQYRRLIKDALKVISDNILKRINCRRKRKRTLLNDTPIAYSQDMKNKSDILKIYVGLDDWITNVINGDRPELKCVSRHSTTVDNIIDIIKYSHKFVGWQRIVPYMICYHFNIKAFPDDIDNNFIELYDQKIPKRHLNSTLNIIKGLLADHPLICDIYNPHFDPSAIQDVLHDVYYPRIFQFVYDRSFIYEDLLKIAKLLPSFDVNSVVYTNIINLIFKFIGMDSRNDFLHQKTSRDLLDVLIANY